MMKQGHSEISCCAFPQNQIRAFNPKAIAPGRGDALQGVATVPTNQMVQVTGVLTVQGRTINLTGLTPPREEPNCTVNRGVVVHCTLISAAKLAEMVAGMGIDVADLRNNGKFPDSWGLVGGKIEQGETILEGLEREIQEELGGEIKEAKIIKSSKNEEYVSIVFDAEFPTMRTVPNKFGEKSVDDLEWLCISLEDFKAIANELKITSNN